MRVRSRQLLAYAAAPLLVGGAVLLRQALVGVAVEPETNALLLAVAGAALVAAVVALVAFCCFVLDLSMLGQIFAIAPTQHALLAWGAFAFLLAMLALGASFAGVAGALEAHYTFMVAPSTYSFTRVVDMLVYAVVGGTSVFYGPVVGATFLTALPEVIREASQLLHIQPGPIRLFGNGAVLLVVILYLPEGLASLPGRLRAWRRARREPRAA